MRLRIFFLLLLITNICYSQNDENIIISTEELTASLAEISTNLKAITDIKNKKYDKDINEDKNLINTHEIAINNKFEDNGKNVFVFNPFRGSSIPRNVDEVLIVKEVLDIFKLDVSEISHLGFSNIKIHKNASECNLTYTATFSIECDVYKDDGKGNKDRIQFNKRKKVFIKIKPITKRIEYILTDEYVNSKKDIYPEFYIQDKNCNSIDDSKEDTDNDGITNNLDKCPDVFGIKEKAGCPLTKEDLELIAYKENYNKLQKELDSIKSSTNPNKKNIKELERQLANQSLINLRLRNENEKYKKEEKEREARNNKVRLKDSYFIKNDYPFGDYDKDGIINSDDRCVKRKGTKDNHGCPRRWGVNISLGTGVMFHPKVYPLEDENTYITETTTTSLRFDSSKGFPLEIDASIQYRFNELGNLNHGFTIGAGYNTYTFKYFDEANQPPYFSVNVANTISYASYLSLRAGYFFEFGENVFYYKKSDRKIARIEVGYNQRFRAINWLNNEQPDFQFTNPSYTYIRVRYSLMYINFEYPLNDFINSRIINQNDNFTPYILSFGVEVPFRF